MFRVFIVLSKVNHVNQNQSQRNACPDAERCDVLQYKSLLLDASHLGIKVSLLGALAFVACPVDVFRFLHCVNSIAQDYQSVKG